MGASKMELRRSSTVPWCTRMGAKRTRRGEGVSKEKVGGDLSGKAAAAWLKWVACN